MFVYIRYHNPFFYSKSSPFNFFASLFCLFQFQDPEHDREEMKRPKYLDQEKFSYIQNYLEKSEAQSVTTEPSDSGLPRSHGTLSELGMEEISGKIKTLSVNL